MDDTRSDKTELRGLAPVELVQALDAIAHTENLCRNEYVNRVLDAHVKSVLHKQILIGRMLKGNPMLKESDGSAAE